MQITADRYITVQEWLNSMQYITMHAGMAQYITMPGMAQL